MMITLKKIRGVWALSLGKTSSIIVVVAVHHHEASGYIGADAITTPVHPSIY
jgi:hypothetical protein